MSAFGRLSSGLNMPKPEKSKHLRQRQAHNRIAAGSRVQIPPRDQFNGGSTICSAQRMPQSLTASSDAGKVTNY